MRVPLCVISPQSLSSPRQANKLEQELSRAAGERERLAKRTAEAESQMEKIRQAAMEEQQRACNQASALAAQLEAAQKGAAAAQGQASSVRARASILEQAWKSAVKVRGGAAWRG